MLSVSTKMKERNERQDDTVRTVVEKLVTHDHPFSIQYLWIFSVFSDRSEEFFRMIIASGESRKLDYASIEKLDGGWKNLLTLCGLQVRMPWQETRGELMDVLKELGGFSFPLSLYLEH